MTEDVMEKKLKQTGTLCPVAEQLHLVPQLKNFFEAKTVVIPADPNRQQILAMHQRPRSFCTVGPSSSAEITPAVSKLGGRNSNYVAVFSDPLAVARQEQRMS